MKKAVRSGKRRAAFVCLDSVAVADTVQAISATKWLQRRAPSDDRMEELKKYQQEPEIEHSVSKSVHTRAR